MAVNPLANMMQGAMNPMANMMGGMNPMQIIKAFNQFKNTVNITPAQAKAKIEQAINSGQITWDDVNQMKEFAQSIGIKP